jgi:hypothetical protein
LPPEPADPRGGGVGVHFGKEFSEERRVLGGDGEDAETSFFLRDTDIVPSDLALAAIAGFLSGPEESTPAFINSRDNTGRENTRSHGMGNHCSEDRINEDKPAANGEGPAPPSREAHITFRHDGGEIRKPELMGGKGEAKIGLRETRYRTSKGGGHRGCGVRVSVDGNKGAFMVVDGKTSGRRENIQHMFLICNMVRDSTADDK